MGRRELCVETHTRSRGSKLRGVVSALVEGVSIMTKTPIIEANEELRKPEEVVPPIQSCLVVDNNQNASRQIPDPEVALTRDHYKAFADIFDSCEEDRISVVRQKLETAKQSSLDEQEKETFSMLEALLEVLTRNSDNDIVKEQEPKGLEPWLKLFCSLLESGEAHIQQRTETANHTMKKKRVISATEIEQLDEELKLFESMEGLPAVNFGIEFNYYLGPHLVEIQKYWSYPEKLDIDLFHISNYLKLRDSFKSELVKLISKPGSFTSLGIEGSQESRTVERDLTLLLFGQYLTYIKLVHYFIKLNDNIKDVDKDFSKFLDQLLAHLIYVDYKPFNAKVEAVLKVSPCSRYRIAILSLLKLMEVHPRNDFQKRLFKVFGKHPIIYSPNSSEIPDKELNTSQNASPLIPDPQVPLPREKYHALTNNKVIGGKDEAVSGISNDVVPMILNPIEGDEITRLELRLIPDQLEAKNNNKS